MRSIVQTDKTLDIKGLSGQRPAILTGRTLDDMGPGQVLQVITNEAAARQSIPELCRGRGCEILDVREEGGTLCFIIRK
jgi:TusA-related sulfurtransferase